MQEFEGKFLNVEVETLQKKLQELGATHVGDFHYRRIVFDYEDLRLDDQAAWVRLRDEGDQVTLSFKQRLAPDGELGKDGGMKEYEVTVSDFDKTAAIMKSIGLTEKFYLENKRTRWVKDGVEYDFDTWPLLKTYLESEAGSDDEVDRAAEELGLDIKKKLTCSATQIYKIEGIRDKDYKKITFEEQIKK